MRAADFTKMVEGDVVRTKFATKQAQKNKDQYQRQPDIEIPLYDRVRNQSVLPKYAYLSKDKLEPFDHFEIQIKSPTATRIIGVTTDSRKVLVSTFMAPPETVEKFVAAMNRGGFSDVPIQRVSIKGYNDTDTKLDERQGVTEGLTIDVPNEEWLQDKIDYAERKGRDEWGAPFFGSTTAYVRPNPQVSVVRLELLKGMRNEQNNVRKKDLEWLMAHMEKTGKLPLTNQGEEYAPFVMVAYNGEAWVSEGNHRIMAAYRLGWKKMPVEIKYFDGGERVQDGIMYPGKIGL
jgi:hypothetical protein